MPSIAGIIERLGQHEILRPLTLGTTLWLTYSAYDWAREFASLSERSGPDVAMIIAAVIAPISLLQGYVFKAYIAP